MEIWLPAVCALFAAALVWFLFAAPARSRADRAEAGLEAERRAHAVRLEEIEKARGESESRFAALAAEALGKNNKSFLDLADRDLKAREEAVAALVKPIREELKKVEERAQELEKSRKEEYGAVTEQVKALQSTTGKLALALAKPAGAGMWGERQLRRVLEMAGMIEHVDFNEQVNLPGETGAQRPDAVIHLPGGKSVVVDAKAPLQAYLRAVAEEDETKRATDLDALAKHVHGHVKGLSSKEYWNALPGSPDFVVMFVPSDAFVAAAFEREPGLFDEAVNNKVLIATPVTLIALVKAVAYGWQQEALTENAQKIAEEGRILYDRVRVFGEHMAKLGQSLKQAVSRYNDSVGSLEKRVLPSARRLETLEAASPGSSLPEMSPLDIEPTGLQAAELTGPAEEPGAEKDPA